MEIIKRERWIITRNNREEVLCGLAKNFQFKNVKDIEETSIKTYRSKAQALAAFESSWRYRCDFDIETIKVIESIELICGE